MTSAEADADNELERVDIAAENTAPCSSDVPHGAVFPPTFGGRPADSRRIARLCVAVAQIKQERKKAASAGLRIVRLRGRQIKPRHWEGFERCYQRTVAAKSGQARMEGM